MLKFIVHVIAGDNSLHHHNLIEELFHRCQACRRWENLLSPHHCGAARHPCIATAPRKEPRQQAEYPAPAAPSQQAYPDYPPVASYCSSSTVRLLNRQASITMISTTRTVKIEDAIEGYIYNSKYPVIL